MPPIDSPTPESFIAARIAQAGQSRRSRSADAKLVKANRQRRDEWKARLEALKDAQHADRQFRRFEADTQRDRQLWKPRFSRKSERAAPSFKAREKADLRRRRTPAALQFDIIDRAGRRGVFLKADFDGAAGNPLGVMRRRVLYSALSQDVLQASDGTPVLISNVAKDLAEAVVVVDEIEAFNRAQRKNAKLSVNLIVGFPRGSSATEQERIVRLFTQRICGDHQLPYVAYIHRPLRGGKVHNPHAHITLSFRPVVRQRAYRYLIGKELRVDLDGPEGMLEMRKILAEVTTRVMREGGRNHEYTHLSNCARGLPLLPQQSLTKGEHEAAMRGEYVAKSERNRSLTVSAARWTIDQIKARTEARFAPLRAAKANLKTVTPLVLAVRKPVPPVTRLKTWIVPILKLPVVRSAWIVAKPTERIDRSEALSSAGKSGGDRHVPKPSAPSVQVPKAARIPPQLSAVGRVGAKLESLRLEPTKPKSVHIQKPISATHSSSVWPIRQPSAREIVTIRKPVAPSPLPTIVPRAQVRMPVFPQAILRIQPPPSPANLPLTGVVTGTMPKVIRQVRPTALIQPRTAMAPRILVAPVLIRKPVQPISVIRPTPLVRLQLTPATPTFPPLPAVPEKSIANASAMSLAKENARRELTHDEGADLVRRLERDKPPLKEEWSAIIPVDQRAFSEAELEWMRRDLLTMHRLMLEQRQREEEKEKLDAQIRRAREAREFAKMVAGQPQAIEHKGPKVPELKPPSPSLVAEKSTDRVDLSRPPEAPNVGRKPAPIDAVEATRRAAAAIAARGDQGR